MAYILCCTASPTFLLYTLLLFTVVWNFKSQEARLVYLTPSNTWGGAGMLGVTIRLDNYAGAEDRLVRVLAVESGSPAAVAGLQPETDFLLGTTHESLESMHHLASSVLEANVDRVVELYVYNSDTDRVRVVALLPTYQWGEGRGLLGAEVGTGYLHRLPFKTRGTSGSSVERKVRYVVKDNNGNPNNNNNNFNTSVGSGGGVLMENEPQLEMEPAESDDDDEVESVILETPERETYATKHDATRLPTTAATTTNLTTTSIEPSLDEALQVGVPSPEAVDTHTSTKELMGSAEQRQRKAIPRAPSSLGATRGLARAPSSAGLDPHDVQAIFEKPPLVEAILETVSPHRKPHNNDSFQQHQQLETSTEQHNTPQRPLSYQTNDANTHAAVQPFYAPTTSSINPTLPPPINLAFAAPTQNSKPTTALSPLGPPPKSFFGGTSSPHMYYSATGTSAAASTQPPMQQYSYGAAPLPPPPAGYRNQPIYPTSGSTQPSATQYSS